MDPLKVAEINFCNVRGALTKAKCLKHHMKEERTENKDKKILTLDFAPVIMEVTMKGVVDGNFLLLIATGTAPIAEPSFFVLAYHWY